MKARSSVQSKACDISAKVKATVWERDKHRCVVCWSNNAFPNAHALLSRAHGGRGIEQNVVTLCQECHRKYDQGTKQEHDLIYEIIIKYMQKQYKGLKISDVIYQKRT